MNKEDLSFITKDKNGVEVINDILMVIPNEKNKNEPYVIYTNYELDENDEFINYYAILKKENDSYYLDTNISDEEKDYILKMKKDEIVSSVNQIIGENIDG